MTQIGGLQLFIYQQIVGELYSLPQLVPRKWEPVLWCISTKKLPVGEVFCMACDATNCRFFEEKH